MIMDEQQRNNLIQQAKLLTNICTSKIDLKLNLAVSRKFACSV